MKVPTLPDNSFLAHVGQESWMLLHETLMGIKERNPTWRLGATAWIPRQRPSTTQEMVSQFQEVADFVIADPEYHRLELEFERRGVARRDMAYLEESAPAVNRERLVDNALGAQIECGATILVTPCLTHGITGNRDALDATLDLARLGLEHPLVKGRAVLIGVTVTDSVLTDNKERNNLLDELVELPKAPIYLRMRLSHSPPGRRPFHARDSVLGLRRTVESLAGNGRKVLLPQSGVTGWLMLPFGASAFGAGSAASTQRTVPPSSGGGGQPPLDWYFLPQLLTFVLATEVPALRKVKGFKECGCPYCKDLFSGRGAFNDRTAGQHFVYCCARLAADLAASSQKKRFVREQLEAAEGFWKRVQSMKVPLDPRSTAPHLGDWLAVLRDGSSQ